MTERSDLGEQARQGAPGAVPPTGGVPPEDAAAAAPGARERSATDDLTDGIDLIRRAARKAIGALDPRIEAAAEQALRRLQALDQSAEEAFRRKAGPETVEALERLATEVGRDIEALVGRVATRVEAVLDSRK